VVLEEEEALMKIKVAQVLNFQQFLLNHLVFDFRNIRENMQGTT
jgi:hypothetical protein